MANPLERTSQEHLWLYNCWLDLLREAMVHDNKDLRNKHLYQLKGWFDFKRTGMDFRNKQRGANAEALDEELKEEL